MNGLKAMGTGARAALLAGGALIAAATGYGIWSVNQDTSAPVTAAAESPAAPDAPATEGAAPEATAAAPVSEPVAEPAAEQAVVVPAEPQAPDAQTPETEAIVPTFDLVRVEPDGQALVAGQAEPGSKIVLRLDGAEISASTTDAQGNFAVLFVLDPSTSPRMLTMGSILPGQQEVAALGEVALAPTTAAVVAVAEPVAEAPEAMAQETAPEIPPEAAPTADAPAALLITKDGVNVLQSGDQPAADGGKSDLAIDTISYTAAGDVQLAGRAEAEAVLRVYLDNAPLIDVAVGDDGQWASTMPAIEPGIYTLRVDALAADGTVTARFETPFKRETQDALAAAVVPEAATEVVPEASPEVEAEAIAATEPAPEAPAVEAPEAVVAADAPAAVEAPATSTAAEVPAETVAPAPVAETPVAKPVSITVQPGFTLWGIASEQFGDGVLYVQVFEANKDKIRDPNLIYPGQVFVIPAGSE